MLVLGGIRLRVEDGQLELAATDMELSLRTSLEADVDGDGEVVVPGRLLLDIVALAAGRDVSIEHRSDESVLADHAGLGELPPAHLLGGGLPAPARHRVGRSCTRSTARRCSRRSAASAARRRATRAGRADRHPRALRAGQAGHGRDRLLPARRQGDAARRARSRELEAIIPARALQELRADRSRRRRDAARRAREPRRLRDRRRLADDAPHRRPVPELPPAAAGAVRARAAAAARGAARRRPPRRR